jgi:autotransporter-associated beta strand protein
MRPADTRFVTCLTTVLVTFGVRVGLRPQNRGVTLAGGTIQNGTLSSSGSFAMQYGNVSAALSGTCALPKTTVGTVILSEAYTYAGGTTVSAPPTKTRRAGWS